MKYRLRKSIQVLGGVCTAVLAAATISYSSFFLLDRPDEYGFKGVHSTLLVGGLGLAAFGFMTLLSAGTLVAYYVDSFEVKGSTIRVRSVFQNRQFELCEVDAVTWRLAPSHGSILFRIAGGTVRLDLYGYSNPDRLAIIRLVHSSLPLPRQTGWDMFCHKIALPLRDGIPSSARVDDSIELVPLTRKRYDRLLFSLLPPTLLGGLALGWSLGSWEFLVLPAAVVGFWLLLRVGTPRDGERVVHQVTSPTGRVPLLLFSVLITYLLLRLCLDLAGVETSTACGIALGVFLAALFPLLRALRQGLRQQRLTELQGAATANEAWQKGELGAVT